MPPNANLEPRATGLGVKGRARWNRSAATILASAIIVAALAGPFDRAWADPQADPGSTKGATPPAPASGFDATLAALSDYRLDGVSESNRRPTWQANLTYWRASGLYAGFVLTGVDFQDTPRTPVELDLYAGQQIPIAGYDLNLQFVYITYPHRRSPGPSYDFIEPEADLAHTFKHLTLKGALAWSPSYTYGAGEAWSLKGAASYDITNWLQASGHVRRLWLSKAPSLTNWDVGATATWRRLSLDVRYGGTDLNSSQCYFTNWCALGASASLTYRLLP